MTSSRTHLPSGQSGWVDTRPALLDRLAVGPTDADCVIERIICLARGTVARKMEFWNEVGELQVLDIEIGVVVGNSLEMMNGPFACNIVRDDDIADSEPFQDRRDNVIRVYVSVRWSKFVYHQQGPTTRTFLLAADRRLRSFA